MLSSYSSFAYDGFFNLTGLSSSVPAAPSQGGTQTFGYDAKDRLTGDSSTRNGGYSFSFGYDNAFNPTTWKGAGQGFNSNNQRTGAGFAYDINPIGRTAAFPAKFCSTQPQPTSMPCRRRG